MTSAPGNLEPPPEPKILWQGTVGKGVEARFVARGTPTVCEIEQLDPDQDDRNNTGTWVRSFEAGHAAHEAAAGIYAAGLVAGRRGVLDSLKLDQGDVRVSPELLTLMQTLLGRVPVDKRDGTYEQLVGIIRDLLFGGVKQPATQPTI